MILKLIKIYIPVTNRLSAEKIRGNCGMIDPRATLTMLYSDSLANNRTRTSGSCRQFNTGDTNSSTYFSVSYDLYIQNVQNVSRFAFAGKK